MDNSLVPADADARDRRIVIVIGPGRSGTSTVAGALAMSGLEVPGQPVRSNDSNPQGFFEPRWVVDFHKALLKTHRVASMDPSPAVRERMEKAAARPEVRDRLRSWLEERLRDQPQLVVKDPRTIWFSGLWTTTARELGVEPGFLTMLRHPAEVSASHRSYYQGDGGDDARAVQLRHVAGWVNVVLTAEQVTSGSPRTFVPYADLLADWRSALTRIGQDLALRFDPATDAPDHPVDQFIDPDLRRLRGDWDSVDVPASLRDLGERMWVAMAALVMDPASTEVRAQVQAIRQDYLQMTEDALTLSQSVVRRTKIAARRRERREMLDSGYVLPAGAEPPPDNLARSLVRRLTGRST